MLCFNLHLRTGVLAALVLFSFRLTAGMEEAVYVSDSTSLGLTSFGQSAEFGEFASAAFVENCGVGSYYNITGAGANCINSDCGVEFEGTNFGAFNQFSGGLVLQGGEIKTWKSGSGNVCNSSLCYAVYLSGETPTAGDFVCINLPFQSNCCGTEFCDGFGPCLGNDQKWFEQAAGVDLTANPVGNYVLEVYFDYTGSDSDPGGCEVSRRIETAGGNGFIATFEVVENGAATICTLLPVELSGFGAVERNGEVHLQWSTASEYRNDRFEVERSLDGVHFEAVGAVAGVGYSTSEQTYSFIDPSPPAGRQLYYRLRQVDTDGAFTFSVIRTIFVSQGLDITVQPNPTSNHWAVRLDTANNAQYLVRDLRGNKLFEIDANQQVLVIDASGFAPGVYLLEVSDGQESHVIRLMKR